jgi:predicted AAA+ superfamily ATPase
MDSIYQKSLQKVQRTELSFTRYLIEKIDWQDRLIIIKGARGVGKTTLLLQHIKQEYGLSEEMLYVSLDDIWFAENRLTDLTHDFVQHGGTHLYLDEVHKYPDWAQEIKNIYDDYPSLHIVATSSSALYLFQAQGDLSRRAVQYELPELSLREYIQLTSDVQFPTYTLEQVLSDHVKISAGIADKIRPLKYLRQYYTQGNYPYVIENPDNYTTRLQQTAQAILEVDLPAILNIDYSSVTKLKRLLYVIATSVPFKPNIAKLSRKIQVSRDTLLRYIHYLSEAHLIALLRTNKQGITYLTKPDKIYLHNTNLLHAIAEDQVSKGTQRETFFLNQVRSVAKVHHHPQTDFWVNNQFAFEVGGKNKSRTQIKELDDAYIVSDDIEIGYQNRIPLWLFGFLY